jgi:3-dehydroquinate synthase
MHYEVDTSFAKHPLEKFEVQLSGDAAYPVYVCENLILFIKELIPEKHRNREVFIITDKNVWPLLKGKIGLSHVLEDNIFILPSGESSKSFEQLEKILSWLAGKRADRNSMIWAIGGGVVGDIAGLAAGLYARGIPYVQIPTSLMAQVDSAIGGKTAINLSQGKNLVGLFNQPLCVVSDCSILKTLPIREIKAGYAEVLKYALIDNAEYFEKLKRTAKDIKSHGDFDLFNIVCFASQSKCRIVSQDEKDQGARMLLNLGHSFAHAIEVIAGYNGDVLHGEAVAAGLYCAAVYSHTFGYMSDDPEELRTHLHECGIETSWRKLVPHATVDQFLKAMQSDKKNENSKLTLILLKKWGQAFIQKNVSSESVGQILESIK